jgi:hypothetical protein
MIEVALNKHRSARRLRLAPWDETAAPKVLKELSQRGGRVRIATLAACSTRSTRQEQTDPLLIELGDRYPRVPHPLNERVDRSPLVVLRLTAYPALPSVARSSAS